MKLLKNFLLTTLFSVLAVPVAWAETAQSWSLSRDMFLMDEKAPADSPWAFLQNKAAANIAANYNTFPEFFVDQCGTRTITCWRDLPGDATTLSVKESFVFSGSGKSFVFKKGDVTTHPGTNSKTVIRWSSPVTGNINILGRINDLHDACGDGVAWALNLDDTVVKSGNLPNGGSSIIKADAIAVTPASSIYLIVDKKATHFCDTTSLDLMITN